MKSIRTAVVFLLSMLAFALAVPAFAGEVFYEDDEVAIKLTNESCENADLAKALAPLHAPSGAAVVKFRGKTLAACWSIGPDGIYVMDEAGSGGGLPDGGFHAEACA